MKAYIAAPLFNDAEKTFNLTVDDAVRRFPPGTRVTVDGGTGDVRAEGS